MYFRPARTLFGLVAVAGAVAVGITTHDAGFTALTFIGSLMLPRILGFRGRRFAGGPWGVRADHGRGRFEQRVESWHRQAHGDTGVRPTAAPTAGA